MLKSKIHRATITDCDLHYVGSITIDPDLLEAADILEHEQVHVLDIDNGARFETYTIRGERGSGKKSSDEGYGRVERASGSFLRRFTLPESADAEAIKASHVNGVLEVSIPKRPQEQPRRISVQAA